MRYLFYLLLFVQYAYMAYTAKKYLHMLQQNLYNENNRYIKWIGKNRKQVFLNLNLYGILFAILLFYTEKKEVEMFFLGVLILVYLVSLYVDKGKRKLEQNKKNVSAIEDTPSWLPALVSQSKEDKSENKILIT